MQRAADSGRYDDGTGEKIGRQLYSSRNCDCITVFLVKFQSEFQFARLNSGTELIHL